MTRYRIPSLIKVGWLEPLNDNAKKAPLLLKVDDRPSFTEAKN